MAIHRKVGERAVSYLDSIDLSILEILGSEDANNNRIGVLELASRLDLKHKNLKPHIDKLMFLDLIFAWKHTDGKIKLMTTLKNMDNLGTDTFDSKAEYMEALKKQDHDKALLKTLQMIRGYNHDVEMKRSIDIDLRKSKGIKGRMIIDGKTKKK